MVAREERVGGGMEGEDGEEMEGEAGGGWERDGGRGWVSSCKLLHIERISNKVLLYSTKNYIPYSMTDFPSGPVAKTPCSQCRGPGFDP